MRRRQVLLKILKYRFPLLPRPFIGLARELGLTETAALERLIAFLENGDIRRFGAVLNHRKLGFKVNVLVAWKTAPSSIEALGRIFSRIPQISHCYERRSFAYWPYNLYTMIHAKKRKDACHLVRRLSRNKGIKDYVLLFTLKEYKKVKAVI